MTSLRLVLLLSNRARDRTGSLPRVKRMRWPPGHGDWQSLPWDNWLIRDISRVKQSSLLSPSSLISFSSVTFSDAGTTALDCSSLLLASASHLLLLASPTACLILIWDSKFHEALNFVYIVFEHPPHENVLLQCIDLDLEYKPEYLII